MPNIYIVFAPSRSILGIFTKKSDANLAAEGKGEYGSNALVVDYPLYNSFNEFESARIKELKRTALEKLSKEEISALGIVI